MMHVDIINLDFCKDFDCVPHQLLLCKLKAYSITASELDWIIDFLSNRQQSINVIRYKGGPPNLFQDSSNAHTMKDYLISIYQVCSISLS